MQCRMWVRNGYSMWSLSYTYRNSIFYSPKAVYPVPSTFNLQCADVQVQDIFLLQVCATMLGPEQFIITALDRFGLTEWFTIEPKKKNEKEDDKKIEREQQMMKLAEDFIRLLLLI